MKTETREFEIEATRSAQPDGERIAPLVLSTSHPVERDFGKEILDHSPGSVDLSRAPLPLLESHNAGALPVGVVENLQLDGDKLRGQLRLSKSARAGEIWQDIQDRIIRGVSVGYQITKTQNEPDGVVRATRWQPLEASLVSIPADPRAGIYRNLELNMTPQETAQLERDRVAGILAIGDKFSRYLPADAARTFISDGKLIEEFRSFTLDRVGTAQPLRSSLDPDDLGISGREKRNFSIVNAIRAQLPENMREGVEVDAGYEREVSQEIGKRSGKSPKGVYIPMTGAPIAGMQKRDLAFGGSGANLVETQLLQADFINLLRNRTQVLKLGAKLLTGLVGNVAIPAQTAGATAAWVAENAPLAESDQTFAQLLMSPHQVGIWTKMSRRLLLQATPGIEQLVTEDIALQIAVAVDEAAVGGTGGVMPTGILNTAGVGSVALGADGGPPTYASIIALYQAVAQANADVGQLGFLTNAQGKATLLQTPKIGNTYPTFCWEDALDDDTDDFDGSMINYRAAVSQNIPSDLVKGTSGAVCSALIFGNWSDMFIGQWNALDLIVDPYTYSSSGELSIVGWQDIDIGIRHAASFAAIVDMLTV